MKPEIQKTKEAYDAAFEKERKVEYPSIKSYEARLGYAISRNKLEDAARVLACPVKVNPPNWQHGRVVYATARKRFEALAGTMQPVTMLDIGTAKGFSALCALWAMRDSKMHGKVHSVDVRDPTSTDPKNSVADFYGPQTLAQVLEPWPEADEIAFRRSTGIDWLASNDRRVHFAFIDGKHTFEAVSAELKLLTQQQGIGDAIVLDDLQIPGVAKALVALGNDYEFDMVIALPNRSYGIAWRTK